MAKRAAYQEHASAMTKLLGAPALPSCTVIIGASEFLRAEARRKIIAKARQGGATVISQEANEVNDSSLAAFSGQTSLFEPESLLVLNRCEAAKNLPKHLKVLPAGAVGATGAKLCCLSAADAPTVALRGELERLNAVFIPCHEPWPEDLSGIIKAQCAELGLTLAPDAVQLLIQALGTDLIKHANELRRIALLFPTSADGRAPTLSTRDLRPVLGMLREDEALQLGDLLLKQEWAKGQALLTHLLDRGESALAILGMLAAHCRRCLRTLEALDAGVSPAELSQILRLPPFVAKSYSQRLRGSAASTLRPRLRQALSLCRDADTRFKSSAIGEDLLLGQIIDALGS